MNDFTASNGVRLWAAPGTPGALAIDDGDGAPLAETIDRRNVDALREYFEAEADEKLSRWRDPAQPEFVVYPAPGNPGRVIVFDETTGVQYRASRDSARGGHGSAAHYFDAHPEPKPWHDAKPGEVWELTLENREPAAFYPSKSLPGHFTPVMPSTGTTAVDFEWPLIIAGRRIWPEVSS